MWYVKHQSVGPWEITLKYVEVNFLPSAKPIFLCSLCVCFLPVVWPCFYVSCLNYITTFVNKRAQQSTLEESKIITSIPSMGYGDKPNIYKWETSTLFNTPVHFKICQWRCCIYRHISHAITRSHDQVFVQSIVFRTILEVWSTELRVHVPECTYSLHK